MRVTPPELPKLEKGERDLGLVEIDVRINAQGQLTALRPVQGTAADLVPALEKAINRWRFLPAKRDGRAVDWATRVSAQLKAMPVQGGFALAVRKIDLHAVWVKHGETQKIARYPVSARRQGQEAFVLVLATPHPEGGGADVLSVEVNGKTATRSNDLLGEAARVSVSGWPWEVLEWDGQRYAEQICAPMSFSLGRNNRHIRQWSGDKDAQQKACRKMPGGVDFEPIKLAEDVIGRRL
ncbi:MAG: hypothetical protein H7A20_06855 [Rhodanobacteraceae bacterium]|nr:hypothetical protein [Rhodanobacteraceae bacterium]HPF72544.1 hypothetical protein [Xanthomonadaceae bacterium]HRX98717.1 hypothetical protein [Xanthomonadaceae bacterium]